MLDLLKPGGIIMFPLLLCSVLALAIIIERFWTLRVSRLAPKSLVQGLWTSIRKKELNARKIKELKEDRHMQGENFAKLENFVLEAVADEIREFHSDKRELAEKKVQLVREGREQLADAKKQFIKRAAEKVESTISSALISSFIVNNLKSVNNGSYF